MSALCPPLNGKCPPSRRTSANPRIPFLETGTDPSCVLPQNLENDEDGAQASPEPDGGVGTRDSGPTSLRSSQWSFSTISSGTQRSYRACCSWTQHPLIQKNRRVVLASFLLLLLGLARPAVYHVIFIYCAVKGQRGFQFFYLPYFEK
ncbi:transmembrane protein 134 [Carlito syrichta]|uniref:Transmembrane protein 134 n=1 Tax=Carlito syrichta TaxID=1868482 RepID=A0A3Q0DQI3_CARSF|nr:transmembrane protein 134 [Carlito syrichta]